MTRVECDVAYLASCAVSGRLADADRVAGMDLDAVMGLASRHMVSAAVAFALEAAGVADGRCVMAIAAAQRRAVVFQDALEGVESALTAAGIWYAPLKGAVIRDLYPAFAMREFADFDVLVDPVRAADVRDIMVGLGFSVEHFGTSNHDVYFRRPSLNFEMHTALFGPSHDQAVAAYWADVASRLVAGEGCRRDLAPEDLYLYCVAHENKHYEGGGTGIRSILDTYVLLTSLDLDMAHVTAEAARMGIADFEAANRSLALHLVGGQALTEADGEMLGYILSSGAYGTLAHGIENKMRKRGWSKARYALHRLLVPVRRSNPDYESFASTYPTFYRYRVLLPFLVAYRAIRALRKGRVGAELRALRDV